MWNPYREAYAGLSRDTWLLAVVALVHRSGTMVLPFLALYLTKEHDLATNESGLLLGLYGVGWMVGSWLGGWMTDRIGAPNVQMFGLLAQGAGFLVLGQMDSPWTIAVALFVTGALGDVFRPANVALVTSTCAADMRSKALALNRLAINLGVAVGASAGGFLASVDYGWLFVVDAATCWGGAVLVFHWFRGRRSKPSAGSDASLEDGGKSPWRDVPFLACVAATGLLATLAMQVSSTVPLFLDQRYGMDEEEIGLVFAINPILIVVFEMIVVHRLRDRRPLAIVACGAVGLGAAYALLPLGQGMWWAVVFTLVWTVAEMLESPQTGGFVAGRATDANRGRYMGIYTMSWAAASVAAPLAGTAVYEHASPDTLWYGCAGVGAAVALGLWRLDRVLRRRGE